jgi:hypothetical protein
VRAYDTRTIRQGETEPFHEHTYRFPHWHWFVLSLMFLMVGSNTDGYPRTSPKDGTVTSLQIENGKIRTVTFTEARYRRTVTRI